MNLDLDSDNIRTRCIFLYVSTTRHCSGMDGSDSIVVCDNCVFDADNAEYLARLATTLLDKLPV